VDKQKNARNYRRKWREKQRTNGLCLCCSRPAILGITRCNRHRVLKRVICPECNKVVLYSGLLKRYKFHPLCAKIREKRRAKNRVDHWYRTERGMHLHRLSHIRYEQRHRKLGLCKVCTNKTEGSHRHCKTHLLKLTARKYFGTSRVSQETLEAIELYKVLKEEIKDYG